MKQFTLILAASLAIGCSQAIASTTIFSDDFESGMGLWTVGSGSTGLSIDSTANASPAGGTSSLHSTLSQSRVYHDLGTELAGASTFTSWIYDSTMTRTYSQVLSYSGAGYNQGTLDQLLAIGKYSSVSMPGETYDGTKYQARISAGTGSGWFNLNAAGAPSRSAGWHKFTIERTDAGTVNFYVDDILGRSLTGFSLPTWDSITLGFGTTSTSNGDTWYDGVSVASVPEPSAFAFSLLGGFGLLLACRRRP